jgi:pyruvate formate lyase activating enzyme
MTTGIIFDIKRYTIHDGPGIRTTVFCKGCPLRCLWCHNPEGQPPDAEKSALGFEAVCLPHSGMRLSGQVGREISVDEIIKEIEKDHLFYDQSRGGVTVSGGEPLCQPEFVADLLYLCKQKGIHTALDTCGYAPWESFIPILKLVDLFLYDLKFIDDTLHQKYTAVSNRLILENLVKLSKTGIPIFIRIPVIPDLTAAPQNLTQIAEFILTLNTVKQVSLLTYNFMAEEKYKKLVKTYSLQGLRPLSGQQMNEIKKHFEKYGLAVNIGG